MGYLLLYLGGLLAVLIALNVLLVRTIRGERRSEAEQRRSKSGLP